MMKAICFKDVRPKDVVCERTGGIYKVSALSVDREPLIGLLVQGKCGLEVLGGEPDKILGLVHRPWPEGKTEEDMADWLRSAARRFATALERVEDASMARAELQEALDAYELGKPPEKPRRNESLRDRHMTP